jgi:acetolactate synthase-1/3 small subunit
MSPSRSTTHTIVALVEDKPGVLNRIASKWRQRGFNIESLAVGHSEIPGLSRMTFTVDGATHDVEQVTKQLYKIIEVIKISDITEEDILTREMALIKVTANPSTRSSIIEIANIFRGNIIDVAPDSLIVEATGTEDKIDALYEMLRGYGVKELVRTGVVAMRRGSGSVAEETATLASADGDGRYRRPATRRYAGDWYGG